MTTIVSSKDARNKQDVPARLLSRDGLLAMPGPDAQDLLNSLADADTLDCLNSPANQGMDVVGDVHGCYQELLSLLRQLGYRLVISMDNGLPRLQSVQCPGNRKLLLVGDLVDRGPHSDQVLALAIQLVERNVAIVLRGNHDDKHLRIMNGNNCRITRSYAMTMHQLNQHRQTFRQNIFQFFCSLPLVYEDQDVIAVHAAYTKHASMKRREQLALYGDTVGTVDEYGLPVRSDDWELEYTGKKVIVHGHVPVPEATVRVLDSGAVIWNVDTGCCFGGKLTALRLPSMQLISIPALAQYAQSPYITP